MNISPVPRTAFYPGSFDPLTNGHMEVIRNVLSFVDRIVIGVGVHSGKTPLFASQDRIAMIQDSCAVLPKGAMLDVVPYEGLTVDAAHRVHAALIVRGLRDGTDLDYEMQLAGMNAVFQPAIPTVFVPSSPLVRPISATLVRQIAALGGDVSAFVPEPVAQRLKARFSHA